eukprot:359650-Chlamydomonas_euryale.AAC.12
MVAAAAPANALPPRPACARTPLVVCALHVRMVHGTQRLCCCAARRPAACPAGRCIVRSAHA